MTSKVFLSAAIFTLYLLFSQVSCAPKFGFPSLFGYGDDSIVNLKPAGTLATLPGKFFEKISDGLSNFTDHMAGTVNDGLNTYGSGMRSTVGGLMDFFNLAPIFEGPPSSLASRDAQPNPAEDAQSAKDAKAGKNSPSAAANDASPSAANDASPSAANDASPSAANDASPSAAKDDPSSAAKDASEKGDTSAPTEPDAQDATS